MRSFITLFLLVLALSSPALAETPRDEKPDPPLAAEAPLGPVREVTDEKITPVTTAPLPYLRLSLYNSAPFPCTQEVWGTIAMTVAGKACICGGQNYWSEINSEAHCTWQPSQD